MGWPCRRCGTRGRCTRLLPQAARHRDQPIPEHSSGEQQHAHEREAACGRDQRCPATKSSGGRRRRPDRECGEREVVRPADKHGGVGYGRPDGFDEGSSARIPLSGVLRERRSHDCVQAGRQAWAAVGHPGWIGVEMGPDRRLVGRSAERRLPGQAQHEEAAKAVQVATTRELWRMVFAGDLLRGDVVERPDASSVAGQVGSRRDGPPREAEVGKIGIAPSVEQDVARADIVVDEATLVCGIESVRDGRQDGKRPSQRQRPIFTDETSHARAVEVAHRQV